MRILVNRCFGGYGLSDEAISLIPAPFDDLAIKYENETRTHPDILAVFDALGSKRFSGDYAAVEAVEIPDGMHYYIDEYDGAETVIYSESPINFA